MRTSGYAHIVAAVTISVIAILMVVVAVYWDMNKEEPTNTNVAVNTNTVTNVNRTTNANANATNTSDISMTEGVLNQRCPTEMFGQRENAYDPYSRETYTVNECTYSRESGTLEKRDVRWTHLYKDDQSGCEPTVEEEIASNPYTLFNGCLYKDRTPVFAKTIYSLIQGGDFGDELVTITPEGNINEVNGIGENADEWFRFEHDGKLTMFFRGAAGCGGCVYNGPYLTIDLATGERVMGNSETLPYIPNTVLSPDKTRAVVLDKDDRGQITNTFSLYNFVTLESAQVISTVEDPSGYHYCGDGCYLAKGAITWTDADTVQIQRFETNDSTFGLKTVVDSEGNEILPVQYIPDGDPVVIQL